MMASNVLEKYDIYFYVINLPYRKLRLAHCLNELERIGVPKERIIIVQDGLPENNPKLELYRYKGTAGCAYGHYSAIEISVKNGHEHVIILEDDVTFINNDFLEYLSEFFSECESNGDEIEMMFFKRPPKISSGSIFGKTYIKNNTKFHKVWTHSFYISKKLREEITNNPNILINGTPVDWIYFKLCQPFVPLETLCVQNKEFKSDIRRRRDGSLA